MNKYQNGYYNYNGEDMNIQSMLTEQETLLWMGRPKKNAFIINSATKMMPFALLWLAIDGGIIAMMFSGGMGQLGPMKFFLIGFFALHLLPVWIWIYNVVTAASKWKNTSYAVTDKRILIRTGLVGYEYMNIYYKEISDVHLHVGLIDKMLGVGDIVISCSGFGNKGGSSTIVDIPDVVNVFNMLQRAISDIQADIEYPNVFRPENNPGYNTTYRM